MLKTLPIMLLSSAQKTYPLCSMLCPLQLCHSSYTILLFLMTTLAYLGFRLLCFTLCYAALFLYLTYYAHENTCASFCNLFPWLLHHKSFYKHCYNI